MTAAAADITETRLHETHTLTTSESAPALAEVGASITLGGSRVFMRSFQRLPQVSSYQRDFVPKSFDSSLLSQAEERLNAKLMRRPVHNSISIIKSSSYHDSFLPHDVFSSNRRKAELEFLDHPNNPKRLSPTTGLPFCGMSQYQQAYHELGPDCVPPVAVVKHQTYTLPFLGRSSYKDSFKTSPLAGKALQIKPRTHFALSYPFVGDSQSHLAYKPIPIDKSVLVKRKREVENSFTYPGFYQTTSKRDFVPKLIKVTRKNVGA